MKKPVFNEILWNGVSMSFLEDISYDFQKVILHESPDGIQYLLVKGKQASFEVNGVEVRPKPDFIWVRRKEVVYEIGYEEVRCYDEKLNMTGREFIHSIKGEGLEAAFGCKYLFPSASMFFSEFMANPHLTSEMKRWLKKNMTASWFSLRYDKRMDRKEILSFFRATDLFSEAESMMEVLLLNKVQDQRTLLEAFIITAKKKVETKTSFARFLKEHDFPATLLMDAILSGEFSEEKKNLVRKKIDGQLF